jgi:hypothetical protein
MNLSDAEILNVAATYYWEFEDSPIGTAPVMLNPATATPSFVVNASAALAGSYRIKATVNGVDSAVEILAVPLSETGARIPSFQETLAYDAAGNAKGWHEAQTVFMRSTDAKLAAVGPGTPGDILRQLIWGGGRESHNSDTPMIAGAFALNPNDYDLERATIAFSFVVVAANGNTPLTTNIQLYNLTDSEYVTSSLIQVVNSTTPLRYTAALTVGVGAGSIKSTGEKIYECRIFLSAPPGNPAIDTIELFKAEVRAVFTIV